MPNEEKDIELSNVEIRNAVALTTLLPQILSIMEDMNKKMAKIDENFIKQTHSLNKYVETVNDYSIKVDNLLKAIEDENVSSNISTFADQIKVLKDEVIKVSALITKPKVATPVESAPAPKVEPVSKPSVETRKPSVETPKPAVEPEKPNLKADKPQYTEDDIAFYKALKRVLVYYKNKKQPFFFRAPTLKQGFGFDDTMAKRIIGFYQSNKLFDEGTVWPKKVSEDILDKHIASCNKVVNSVKK